MGNSSKRRTEICRCGQRKRKEKEKEQKAGEEWGVRGMWGGRCRGRVCSSEHHADDSSPCWGSCTPNDITVELSPNSWCGRRDQHHLSEAAGLFTCAGWKHAHSKGLKQGNNNSAAESAVTWRGEMSMNASEWQEHRTILQGNVFLL